MGQVRWTAEAADWLQDIHDYIARDNPAAAQRVARGIYERVELLTTFPEVGALRQRKSGETFRISSTVTTGSPTRSRVKARS